MNFLNEFNTMLSIVQSYLGNDVLEILKNLTISAMFAAYFKLAVEFFYFIPSLVIETVKKSQNMLDVAAVHKEIKKTTRKEGLLK